MKCTIGLAQCCHPQDKDVLALVERWMQQAKERNVDLLVFPESLMTRYEVELGAFQAAAESIDGSFSTAVDALAKKYGIWTVYALNEKSDSERPYNTAILVSDEGIKQTVYRKTHLFDTDFTRESDRMSTGSELCMPAQTPFGSIALAICYDLRFPEVARTHALNGCDILVYPAAWVDGRLKADQWRTLLKARAIENEIFVAGVSRVDDGYIGQSCIVGPNGVIHAAGGVTEELVVATIDTDEIKLVRDAMPCAKHRKPELYSVLTR